MKTSALALSILAAACASLPALAHAGTCDRYERDKAEELVRSIGWKIVKKDYDGGSDISTILTSCDYNSYSEKYEVDVDIYWKGKFNLDNTYRSSGTVTIYESSGNYTYKETYRNQAVTEYENFKIGLGIGLIILDALSK